MNNKKWMRPDINIIRQDELKKQIITMACSSNSTGGNKTSLCLFYKP